MKKLTYLILSLLLLSSCVDNDRQSDLNLTLVKEVDSLSNHLFEFTDLTKIDGVEIQQGTLKYEMAYEGFVSAKENCVWDGYIYPGPYTNSFNLGLPGSHPSQSFADISFFKKGFGRDVKGVATFQKQDSGWILKNFTLLTK